MESESSSIDPRYRPEFQRGYSGEAVPRARPEVPAVEPVRIGPLPAPRSDSVSVEVEVEVDDEAADVPSEDSLPKPPRNPYLIVIPVVAICTFVLGSGLLISQFVWSYSGAFGSGNSIERRFSGVLAYVFSGPLVTIGLATLVGYLFWLAKRKP